mgnify:CR=1 FL=1
MSKGRLTRQELSWLLTQEAQNAAERLRVGVQVLRTQVPPPVIVQEVDVTESAKAPAQNLDASLDALDDMMKMLSSLNQRSSPSAAGVQPPRRGRVDIASLLYEIAPDARVSIEPGSGTEVYGDAAEFRRMLQVLVGHGSGTGSSVTVRRDGDMVRVSVVLGPDASPTAETERAWLSRMAVRFGGRHELEGGTEIISFPAENAGEEEEQAALRRELDEARRQGEAYARELAAVFDRGEEVATVSSMPPSIGGHDERFLALTRLTAGVSAELRSMLSPLSQDLGALAKADAKDEQIETLRRRVHHALEFVSSLSNVGGLPKAELPSQVDLADVARSAAQDCAALADRLEVNIKVRTETPDQKTVFVRARLRSLRAIAREVVGHAIAASPRGGHVDIIVTANARGPRLVVEDAGSPLPVPARRSFLALETHAQNYGRPSGVPLFLASELAVHDNAALELADSPLGGLSVAVTFTNS